MLNNEMLKMNNDIKHLHIVFDVDGTLLDNSYVSVISLREMLILLTGKQHSVDDLKFSIGLPANIIFQRLHINDFKSADALWQQCYEKYLAQIKPFNGIPEVVKKLYSVGYTLGIITSKPRQEYDSEFKIFEFSKYFKTSLCLEDCENPKPSPAALYKYMSNNQITPKDILYIGDSETDYQFCKNSSARFVHAAWSDCKSVGAKDTIHLKKPEDLLTLVGSNI